jgi:hypothetical protein
MKEIPLTQGHVSLIDDEDYELVSRYPWYADVGKWTTYAKSDNVFWYGIIRMHAFIMKPPAGFIVHHIDENGLNNQKYNLENITQMEHATKSKLRYNKSGSLYRGVYLHKSGWYSAEIWRNYKKTYLGLFQTQKAAAEAYLQAAERMDKK